MRSRTKLTSAEAKNIDIVSYLAALGHKPVKIQGNIYWYTSPLFPQQAPTFRVERNRNLWLDGEMGNPQNILDFAHRYFGLPTPEILDHLTGICALHKCLILPHRNPQFKEEKVPLINDQPLRSTMLSGYLQERKIDPWIAAEFCRQVSFTIDGNLYHGIGFSNDSGGFQIRIPWFKGFAGAEDVSTFGNKAEEVLVFEGFIDFLSFLTMNKTLAASRYDIVVLNHLSCFEKIRGFLESHRIIRLYLGRGLASQNLTVYAMMRSSQYQDESRLYRNSHDLNDWYLHYGQ